jgi:ribonuclease BN (tRNA processing enzyme)
MRITILGSSIDQPSPCQFAATYLINDSLAIDAGTLGLMASIHQQRAVEHVILSHAHVDHIATLPIFLDNVYSPSPHAPIIHGSEFTRNCLMQDVFNERLWPNLVRLSRQESPFIQFQPLEDGDVLDLGELRVRAIQLDHVIPCLGFIIEDATAAVAIVSDTGPTEAIWQAAHANPKLKAVFLEAAFPNSMDWLAVAAAHLTPAKLLAEYRKLDRDVPVYAVHIKPAYYEQVVRELKALDVPRLEISRPNFEYRF